MAYKKSNKKKSHHLWNSTQGDNGDVVVHRTEAEKEDFSDFEFVQAKAATSLGLWGASLTDSPVYSAVPAAISDRFSLVAKEMKESGEIPPKIMSWKKLAKAFGLKRVNDCKTHIQFGMKTRLASKELDIPFIMAADLMEDYEKVGRKVLSDVINDWKKMAQSSGDRVSIWDGQAEGEITSVIYAPDGTVENYKVKIDGDSTLKNVPPDSLEVIASNKSIKRSFKRFASKYGKLAGKVDQVLSSNLPKISVDQAADDYWTSYYGPYGEQLVKEVKKRVKADLAKVWLEKQGVDQAAADYWSNYFTDENYGEMLTREVPKKLSPKAKKAQEFDDVESVLTPEVEDLRDGLEQVGLSWQDAMDEMDRFVNDPNRFVLLASADAYGATLRDKSNMDAIMKYLEPYSDDVKRIQGGHVLVNVLDDDGQPNGAFNELEEIVSSLSNSPVLDDEDVNRRETEAYLEAIDYEGSSHIDDSILFDPEKSDTWQQDVFSWLWDNNQEALQFNGDEPYISEEDVVAAIQALGYEEKEEEEEEDLEEEGEEEPYVDPNQTSFGF